MQRGASLPLTPEDEEYNRMMAAPVVKVAPTRGPPPTPERHTTRAEPILEEQFTGFDTIKKGMSLAPQTDVPYYDSSSSYDPVLSLSATANKTSTIVSIRPDTITEEETNDDEFTFTAPSKQSVATGPPVGSSIVYHVLAHTAHASSRKRASHGRAAAHSRRCGRVGQSVLPRK